VLIIYKTIIKVDSLHQVASSSEAFVGMAFLASAASLATASLVIGAFVAS
jgi:hypothetical protein